MRDEGLRVAIVFEGRDTAGKGGTIAPHHRASSTRAPTASSPSASRPSASAAQWYFQRYVEHLPAAGEIALFDRSWYNRAGVERVMGFCTEEQVEDFLRATPDLERMLVGDGLLLVKYWLEVSAEEQEERFQERAERPHQALEAQPDRPRGARRYDDYSRRATRCSGAPTSPRRRGTSWTPTTRSAPAST